MEKLIITKHEHASVKFNARWARTILQRLVGLLKTSSLEANQGLLLSPCSSIHTIGMRYNLDIVFLDKKKKVLKCVSDLKPNRAAGVRKGYYVLELPSGSVKHNSLSVGDQLNWVST